MISRNRKILRIGQAHLAPGMNLVRWQQILKKHGVSLTDTDPWPAVSDDQVDAIFEEIAGIVRAAKAEAASEVIKPLDLYQPLKV